jgi:hypothetical protein
MTSVIPIFFWLTHPQTSAFQLARERKTSKATGLSIKIAALEP